MQNNPRPAAKPMAGYGSIADQVFAPSAPQQYGHATPIPVSNMGDTALAGFIKINHSLMPRPFAKLVIGTQQARF